MVKYNNKCTALYKGLLLNANDILHQQYDRNVKGMAKKTLDDSWMRDYIKSKKILITTVVPNYTSEYDIEAIYIARSLGWQFKCWCPYTTDYEAFYSYLKDNKMWDNWEWDTKTNYDIREWMSHTDDFTFTAFIGFRISECNCMRAAELSGTCVDAMEPVKNSCDFISDKSFNNFAFGELLIAIMQKDIDDYTHSVAFKNKYIKTEGIPVQNI